MRRHATASSARSKARKPSGQGGSSSSRIRLTILIATVAAFLLVPAAQAFANGTMTVVVEGTGSGEVDSGLFGGAYSGEPPISCTYTSPGPATGTCENEMATVEPGVTADGLRATAASGSEFVEWRVEEGVKAFGGAYCPGEKGLEILFGARWGCLAGSTTGGNAVVVAVFAKEEGEEETGPTNKRTLTVTKSPNPALGTGAGTVMSKPKGIKCAAACGEAQASLYKNTVVTLSAKPMTGSTFTGWTGCDSETEGKCVVTLSEAKSVNAAFSGTSKVIVNPQVLTVSKVDNGFETGFGTVKATGLTCEADCTSTEAAYFGGVTEPKPKAAATVTLTAVAALGSEFVAWTGCDSEVEGNCVVSMSAAKSVTAEFAALPKNTLTINKSGPKNSAGTVQSKPKGIKCASACSTASASYSEDTTVVLSATATSGSTFAGWEGCDSETEGKCVVTMGSAKTVTAKFAGASKEVVNPKVLTLTKAGSGYGTVKGTGLTCEPACTTTQVAYFGGITEPKVKVAATVTLTAVSAPGSGPVAWSGCDSEVEGNCVVSMTEAKNVTATFNELE